MRVPSDSVTWHKRSWRVFMANCGCISSIVFTTTVIWWRCNFASFCRFFLPRTGGYFWGYNATRAWSRGNELATSGKNVLLHILYLCFVTPVKGEVSVNNCLPSELVSSESSGSIETFWGIKSSSSSESKWFSVSNSDSPSGIGWKIEKTSSRFSLFLQAILPVRKNKGGTSLEFCSPLESSLDSLLQRAARACPVRHVAARASRAEHARTVTLFLSTDYFSGASVYQWKNTKELLQVWKWIST